MRVGDLLGRHGDYEHLRERWLARKRKMVRTGLRLNRKVIRRAWRGFIPLIEPPEAGNENPGRRSRKAPVEVNDG